MSTLVDLDVLGVAVVLGALTYALRLGGLLLGQRLPRHGRWAYVMDRLPSIIVVTIVAAGVLHAGWQGAVAGAVTLVLAFATPGLLLPMGSGVAVIALLRWLWM